MSTPIARCGILSRRLSLEHAAEAQPSVWYDPLPRIPTAHGKSCPIIEGAVTYQGVRFKYRITPTARKNLDLWFDHMRRLPVSIRHAALACPTARSVRPHPEQFEEELGLGITGLFVLFRQALEVRADQVAGRLRGRAVLALIEV